MDRWFTIIPKGLLALVAIGAGIFFVIASSPPHTVCEAQIEVFRESQKHFLFLDPKKKLIETTKYRTLVNHCKTTNTPGGCYELFQEVKTMIRDLEAEPSDCAPRIGDIDEVKKAMWEIEGLLVQLAWGEKPPTSYHQKFGWLDSSDLSLFCKLKHHIVDNYGDGPWQEFREKLFVDLPGSKDMSREEVWDMSIFSENCAKYP